MGGRSIVSSGIIPDVTRNPQLANHKDFEKRIYELAEQFPKGIPDKILQTDMPEISGQERATAINNLLSKGILDLYKHGEMLLYRIKKTENEDMEDADNEEKVVYDLIKESGNLGIWIRDIRFKSNLTLPHLNKILKILENKKLIKAVKSVSASKKRVYMLFNVEPDKSLTGGAWYSDQDFESEFVTILNQQCLKFLVDRKAASIEIPKSVGPMVKRAKARASLEEIWKFICNLGISKVELSKEDIECILDTLIYDGKIQKFQDGESVYYIGLESGNFPNGLSMVPCGVCPVANDCSERGSVNPRQCIYFDKWLNL